MSGPRPRSAIRDTAVAVELRLDRPAPACAKAGSPLRRGRRLNSLTERRCPGAGRLWSPGDRGTPGTGSAQYGLWALPRLRIADARHRSRPAKDRAVALAMSYLRYPCPLASAAGLRWWSTRQTKQSSAWRPNPSDGLRRPCQGSATTEGQLPPGNAGPSSPQQRSATIGQRRPDQTPPEVGGGAERWGVPGSSRAALKQEPSEDSIGPARRECAGEATFKVRLSRAGTWGPPSLGSIADRPSATTSIYLGSSADRPSATTSVSLGSSADRPPCEHEILVDSTADRPRSSGAHTRHQPPPRRRAARGSELDTSLTTPPAASTCSPACPGTARTPSAARTGRDPATAPHRAGSRPRPDPCGPA